MCLRCSAFKKPIKLQKINYTNKRLRRNSFHKSCLSKSDSLGQQHLCQLHRNLQYRREYTFPKLIWIISPLQSTPGSPGWKNIGGCSLPRQQLILRDFRWITMLFCLDATRTSFVHPREKSKLFFSSLASGFRWYCNLRSALFAAGMSYKASPPESLRQDINWPMKPGK